MVAAAGARHRPAASAGARRGTRSGAAQERYGRVWPLRAPGATSRRCRPSRARRGSRRTAAPRGRSRAWRSAAGRPAASRPGCRRPAGVEHVAGAGRVDAPDPQRGHGRLLAGGVVDGQGSVARRGDDGERHEVGEGVQRVGGGVGAGVGHRLDRVGQERVAGRQLVEHRSATRRRWGPSPRRRRRRAPRRGPARPRPRGGCAERLGGRGRRARRGRAAAAEHRRRVIGASWPWVTIVAVAVVGHRDGHRGVPVGEAARRLRSTRSCSGTCASRSRRSRRRRTPPPARCAARAARTPSARLAMPPGRTPCRRPRPRGRGGAAVQAGEDDVEEDHARQQDVDLAAVRAPTGASGSYVSASGDVAPAVLVAR